MGTAVLTTFGRARRARAASTAAAGERREAATATLCARPSAIAAQITIQYARISSAWAQIRSNALAHARHGADAARGRNTQEEHMTLKRNAEFDPHGFCSTCAPHGLVNRQALLTRLRHR